MTDPTSDKPMAAMFEHCVSVYNKMFEESIVEESSTLTMPTEDGGTVPQATNIYEGYLTRLVSDLGLAAPYYTTVKNLLIKMGSVEQLRRGGGNSKSKWRLVRPPTEEAYNQVSGLVKPKTGQVASLQQQVNDLNARLSRMDDKVNAIWEHIQTGGAAA